MKLGIRDPRAATWLVGPAVAYTVYIFIAGSLPQVGPPMDVSDKTAHFAAFGLMVPLLLRATRYFRPEAAFRSRTGVSVAGSSVLGGLLELWQSFLPSRTADVFDWLADTAGAGLAAVVLLVAVAFLPALLGEPSRPAPGGAGHGAPPRSRPSETDA